MRLGGFVFRPRGLTSLVALLLFALLIGLGFWQLDRAQQKKALQAAFAIQSAHAPLALERLDPGALTSRYRRVSARGRYDGEHQVLFDNQISEGRPGYHVLTPLKLASGGAILVNRGWLVADPARRRTPDVAVSEAEVIVQGRIGQPANPGLQFAEQGEEWPRVVQSVDYQRLSQALGYPLLPALILLDADAEQGYRRDWQPRFGGFGPARHYGYAVQWFALALALAVIYIVMNSERAT